RHGGNHSGFADTIFDDQADKPIGGGTAPFTGVFRPDDPLGSLNGLSAAGTWKLLIQNVSSVNGRGSLNSWSLIVTPASAVPDPNPPRPPDPNPPDPNPPDPNPPDPNPPPTPPSSGPNQAPVASDDFFQMSSSLPLTFTPADLLANDYDPDGNPLAVN